MFSHVVIFWTDPSKPDAPNELIAAAKKYLAPIPGIVNFHVGKMVTSLRDVVDQTYQVALNIQFESKQAQDEYQDHPKSQPVSFTNSTAGIEEGRCIPAKRYPPFRTDFGANKSGPPKARTQPKKSVPKIRVYRDCTCNASRQRGTAHILSREWMKGSLTGSASSLACPRQNWPGSTKYRFTGAPGTRRRDLFLWQSSGYGTMIAWGDCWRTSANRKKRWHAKQKAVMEIAARQKLKFLL